MTLRPEEEQATQGDVNWWASEVQRCCSVGAAEADVATPRGVMSPAQYCTSFGLLQFKPRSRTRCDDAAAFRLSWSLRRLVSLSVAGPRGGDTCLQGPSSSARYLVDGVHRGRTRAVYENWAHHVCVVRYKADDASVALQLSIPCNFVLLAVTHTLNSTTLKTCVGRLRGIVVVGSQKELLTSVPWMSPQDTPGLASPPWMISPLGAVTILLAKNQPGS